MVYLWTTAERSTSTLIIFVDSIGHRPQSCRKSKKTEKKERQRKKSYTETDDMRMNGMGPQTQTRSLVLVRQQIAFTNCALFLDKRYRVKKEAACHTVNGIMGQTGSTDLCVHKVRPVIPFHVQNSASPPGKANFPRPFKATPLRTAQLQEAGIGPMDKKLEEPRQTATIVVDKTEIVPSGLWRGKFNADSSMSAAETSRIV